MQYCVTMSIVEIKRRRFSEFKLKMSIILRRIDDVLAQLFPNNSAPRDYNGPLGYKKHIRWMKMLDSKTRVHALVTSLMFTPAGINSVTQDHTSIFGWMAVLFGSFATVFLFLKQHWDKEIQDERLSKLEQAFKELAERK